MTFYILIYKSCLFVKASINSLIIGILIFHFLQKFLPFHHYLILFFNNINFANSSTNFYSFFSKLSKSFIQFRRILFTSLLNFVFIVSDKTSFGREE